MVPHESVALNLTLVQYLMNTDYIMFQVDVNDAFTKQTLAELFRTPQSQDF